MTGEGSAELRELRKRNRLLEQGAVWSTPSQYFQ